MKTITNTKNYYNNQAKHFAASRDNLRWSFLEQLTSLAKNKQVLDVGCGQGRLLEHVTLNPEQYVGIDFSEGMIAEAKKRHPTYTFFVEDITQPLTFEKQFDIITAIAVLQHMETVDELKQTLQHLTNALKENGILFATIWDIDNETLAEKTIVQEDGIVIPTKNNDESRWYLRLNQETLSNMFSQYLSDVTITLQENNFVVQGRKK